MLTECRRAASKLRVDIRDNNTIDLTHDFDENTLYWPSNPSGFDWKLLLSGNFDPLRWALSRRGTCETFFAFTGFITDPVRFFISSGFYSQPEHLGTHMDAPVHFMENGIGVIGYMLHIVCNMLFLDYLMADSSFIQRSGLFRAIVYALGVGLHVNHRRGACGSCVL